MKKIILGLLIYFFLSFGIGEAAILSGGVIRCTCPNGYLIEKEGIHFITLILFFILTFINSGLIYNNFIGKGKKDIKIIDFLIFLIVFFILYGFCIFLFNYFIF